MLFFGQKKPNSAWNHRNYDQEGLYWVLNLDKVLLFQQDFILKCYESEYSLY